MQSMQTMQCVLSLQTSQDLHGCFLGRPYQVLCIYMLK